MSGDIELRAQYFQLVEQIKITIADTGIGVAEENQKKIFELFGQNITQIKNINSKGAGLGLTISNLIIKGLSGDKKGIELQENIEKKQGSLFSFYLPTNNAT